ncbi:MAG: ubiquinone/menaquinone biosynthesis methyltransferase [marine benthic group bacterium]|nr:ubiquinone/menaquinone biosynthesis methyltransferase [Gemmatimonadota bacterium]
MTYLQERDLGRQIQDRIADPAGKRRYVRDLFGGIAGRYDVTNDLMSVGLHRRWKALALQIADVRAGHVLLDLAAGTGDFALRAARQGRAERIVAADLTVEMLQAGKLREGAESVEWIACDALSLPLADRSVDRVLVGYGLRNFAGLARGLAEIRRVLRPGGKLVALDFGRVEPEWLDRMYLRYLEVSASAAGWVLHRNIESYRYIPESLRVYPAQRGVTDLMQRLGFQHCGHVDLVFGAMAINFGELPD